MFITNGKIIVSGIPEFMLQAIGAYLPAENPVTIYPFIYMPSGISVVYSEYTYPLIVVYRNYALIIKFDRTYKIYVNTIQLPGMYFCSLIDYDTLSCHIAFSGGALSITKDQHFNKFVYNIVPSCPITAPSCKDDLNTVTGYDTILNNMANSRVIYGIQSDILAIFKIEGTKMTKSEIHLVEVLHIGQDNSLLYRKNGRIICYNPHIH